MCGSWLVIASGTPEEVAEVPESYTGQFLKDYLPRQHSEARLAQSDNMG